MSNSYLNKKAEYKQTIKVGMSCDNLIGWRIKGARLPDYVRETSAELGLTFTQHNPDEWTCPNPGYKSHH